MTLDLPGHGQNAQVVATLSETADQIVEAIPETTFTLGGYSFGARVALHVALRHPERVERLIVLGASRGLAEAPLRAARRQLDERWAQLLERQGTAQFLDEWLAQPLFATLSANDDERDARSKNAEGLANSLRHAGTGTQAWLGEQLSLLRAPTLALAGALDTKFSLEAKAIAASVPHGSYDLIDHAGHAAHLEQPEQTAAAVLKFLR